MLLRLKDQNPLNIVHVDYSVSRYKSFTKAFIASLLSSQQIWTDQAFLIRVLKPTFKDAFNLSQKFPYRRLPPLLPSLGADPAADKHPADVNGERISPLHDQFVYVNTALHAGPSQRRPEALRTSGTGFVQALNGGLNIGLNEISSLKVKVCPKFTWLIPYLTPVNSTPGRQHNSS